MDMRDVKDEIIRLLAVHGRLRRAELLAKSDLLSADQAKQLSNALFQLKGVGQITQDEESYYDLVGEEEQKDDAKPEHTPTLRAPATPAGQDTPGEAQQAPYSRLGRPAVRQAIERMLTEHGAVHRTDFAAKSEVLAGATSAEISDALHVMKKDRAVTLGRDGFLRLALAADADSTLQLLRGNADATRQTAQGYIDGLDDPVLDQLLAAAEQAQRALQTYVSQCEGR
jgi:hypothetical protein